MILVRTHRICHKCPQWRTSEAKGNANGYVGRLLRQARELQNVTRAEQKQQQDQDPGCRGRPRQRKSMARVEQKLWVSHRCWFKSRQDPEPTEPAASSQTQSSQTQLAVLVLQGIRAHWPLHPNIVPLWVFWRWCRSWASSGPNSNVSRALKDLPHGAWCFLLWKNAWLHRNVPQRPPGLTQPQLNSCIAYLKPSP